MQEGKRKINVEALLLSAQPVSTLQIVNPFNFITGIAIIACLCIIILFITIFIILQVRTDHPIWIYKLISRLFFQRNSMQAQQRGYSRVSIKKPKVTCNYNVVAVSDGDSTDSDSSEGHNLITPKPQRTACWGTLEWNSSYSVNNTNTKNCLHCSRVVLYLPITLGCKALLIQIVSFFTHSSIHLSSLYTLF